MKNDPHGRTEFKQTATHQQSSTQEKPVCKSSSWRIRSEHGNVTWQTCCLSLSGLHSEACLILSESCESIVTGWSGLCRSLHRSTSCSGKGVGSAFECLSIFSPTLAKVQHILSAGWGADIHYSEGLLLSAFSLFKWEELFRS